MLLVGLVAFEHKSGKSQVVSILCTWHLMKNQRKRAQWGGDRGGWGRVWSSFAVTSEWGRGRGKLCHRKRPVDDRMTWSSGSSQRKTSGGGGDLETVVTGNHQCTPTSSLLYTRWRGRQCMRAAAAAAAAAA
jgi:hypothetical protein